MAQFRYKACSKNNKVVEGVMEAAAERDVFLKLRKQDLRVLLIEEKTSVLPGLFSGLRRNKIKSKDLMRFTSMFSTLVNAGIPLSTCMRTLQEQTENPRFKDMLLNVIQEVESGMDLSAALGRHPTVFNRMYVDLVRAGEAGGVLDVVLERLAAYTEKSDRLRRRISGALTYPAVVSAIACIIVWVILVFVVPQFAETFARAGKQLPLPTRVLLGASNIVRDSYIWLILAAIGGYAGFLFALKDPKFQKTVDGLKLKIPVFGEILLKAALARFARTLAMLLSSGVAIIPALQIVAHITGNRLITDALLSVSDSITSGESFADPMKKSGVFSPLVVQMITVGEATGNMSGMLGKIADFYEDEVDVVIESLSSLIEPMMIVFLGVVLGFVIIALFLPILSLSEVVPS